VDNSSIWLNEDADIKVEADDESWNHTATGWPITPFGIRKVVSWVSNEYKLPVYITENVPMFFLNIILNLKKN
jgi:beta-glucosidase/6-phospho-beta-glucosidase/beta-galactosidase